MNIIKAAIAAPALLGRLGFIRHATSRRACNWAIAAWSSSGVAKRWP
jgi:hypothetical protein